MKKLMIALAAAATTMFSFGDFTSTGFENDPPYKAGELLSTTNDDNGKVDGESGFARTWVALPPEEIVLNYIKAYGEEGAEPTPQKFADEVGSNYLHVDTDTSTLLQRYVQIGGEAASIGDGIYLDTLVKFTPTDQLDIDVETGDKIAITYVGEDANEVENPISNIVVRAGFVSGSTIVPTNYVMNLPDNADFDVNEWHRLTVRSIADVGSSVAPVGFAIYIDGNPKPLTYASDVAAGDSDYVGALNAAVQTYLYNGEKHALLPSLVNSGDNKTTITTVGFKGTGCVDNLAFTADPGFIDEGTAVTIEWDEGVATYTVVDSENNTLVDGAVTGGEAGSTNLLLDTGITYLTVTATYGTGYEAGTWTVTGDGAAISDGTFTVAEGATLTIASMTPKFDVGGDHYGTFAKALDAAVEAGTSAEPATIQLLADVDSALTFTEGYIILDLNGKTIQGGDLDTYSVVNSGATLTIIDSATGGTVVAPTFAEAEGAFYTDDGLTTINAGRFESTVFTEKLLDPEASGDIVVNGGVFYDPDYDPKDSESKFYLADYLGDGVKTTYNAKYFTVGEPIIGTYEVTVTPTENATYAVTGAASNEGDVYTVATGHSITITATPAANYEYAEAPTGWTAGLDGEITIEVSEAGTVAIPEPTEKAALIPVAVPEAVEGLVYNKGEQTGVAAGTGYTLTGNVGTNAASYTAVATLEAGYAWVGGSTDPTNIVWYIGMKGVTPTIVLNPTSAQFDPNKTTVGAYVTSVAAYDGEDLLTENLDYYVSGLTEEVTEAGEYKVWVIQKAWSEGQNYMITNSQYATLTITAGGGSYPTYIEEHTAYQGKYDTWAQTYGADTGSAYEAAFLLNIDPAAADQTLEPVSITMEGGKVFISANQTLTAVNGKVYVKVATTLAGLATAEWTEATLDEGKVQVTPGSSDTAGFYKIKVDF